ncbi:hypothetical protein AAFC00_004562 [Neodothiora populina]|uniref:DUF1772-domain-containing protein n=1 Tax=Neodothiora populina TaxID=2781224 RepID=A0ABR3P385_9PEZI
MDKIPISVDKPAVGVRIAQVVGLTSSAYLAGAIGGISLFSCPALLQAPAPLLAKQWQTVFDKGKFLAPPLSVVSAAIFGGLAYRAPKESPSILLYTAAALLVPSIIPYTVFAMGTVNKKLSDKASSLTDAAAESGIAQEETAHALVDKWATLNLIRSFLPLVATVCAAWASVDNYEILGLASLSLRSGANRMG